MHYHSIQTFSSCKLKQKRSSIYQSCMIYFMDTSGFKISFFIEFQLHTKSLILVSMDMEFQVLKGLKKRG